MSATLMSLLHGSLLQQRAEATDGAACKKAVSAEAPPLGIAHCAGPAATALARHAAAPEPRGARAQMPALLVELMEVAAEVARTDELLKHFEHGAPEGAEAQKWRDVSSCALKWSRDALGDRQSNILERMKELVQVCSERPSLASSEPSPTLDPKPSGMNADAPEFCPTPKQNTAAPLKDQFEAPLTILPGAEHVGSLREDLEKLRRYEPRCCILVRKIKQLGLKSPKILREHFSSSGELAEVLVSHSFEKPSAKRSYGRVRPAPLGFVVFRRPEAAEAIIAAGEEQMVGHGAEARTVLIERYEPTDPDIGIETAGSA